jgi:hypothetical protein
MPGCRVPGVVFEITAGATFSKIETLVLKTEKQSDQIQYLLNARIDPWPGKLSLTKGGKNIAGNHEACPGKAVQCKGLRNRLQIGVDGNGLVYVPYVCHPQKKQWTR